MNRHTIILLALLTMVISGIQAGTLHTAVADDFDPPTVGTDGLDPGDCYQGNWTIKLEGYLANMGDDSECYVYFQWGSSTNYVLNTTEQLLNATGPFNATLGAAAVGKNDIRYFRAAARNFWGTSYSDNETFCLSSPSVFTGVATNITSSSATLAGTFVEECGYYYDNIEYGGLVTFYYDTESHDISEVGDIEALGANISFTDTDEEIGSYSFQINATGLSSSTLYYYRAIGNYTCTSPKTWKFWGDERYFSTGSGNGNNNETYPYDIIATPLSSTEISLQWEMPDIVDEAYILGKTGGWPTDHDDTNATLVYKGDGTSIVHSGLQPGTTYYYRAWGIIDDIYSSNYAQDMATTFIGEQEDVPDIEPPPWWFQEPTCTAYENVPGFVLLQNLAGSYDLPEPTACLLLTILLIIVASIGIHVMVHNALVTLSMAGVFTVGAAIAGLLPLWIIAITVVIGGLVAFTWSRA